MNRTCARAGARYSFVVLLVVAAASTAATATWPAFAQMGSVVPAATVTYTEDLTNFPNPERGFYRQRAAMWLGTARSPLANENFAAIRAEGITIFRVYYVIDEFLDSPLSAGTLAELAADFAAIRTAGFKIIPRFAYNFPEAWPQVPPDATLARVLQHIGQLTPLLQAHADVIAFVEVGFVGAWGEWHHSTNGLVNEDTAVNDSSRSIVEALLAALPPRRAVAIRYPHQKQALFGSQPLDASEAFNQSARARVGAHNDCFLANAIDGGTYTRPPNFTWAIEEIKNFLNLDNRFVPQGGESCTVDEFAQPYIGCPNALADLARSRWSTINLEWHPDVIALWQTQGCLDEIKRRLGYRLRLVSSDLPSEVRQGRTLSISFTVTNSGFASPYNPRDLELVLRHAQSGTIHRLPLAADPRFWAAGDSTVVTEAVNVPQSVEPGTYHVLLNLPDPEPGLRARPEYSIRLANSGTWEPATGFNSLLRTLTVTVPPPFTDPQLTTGITPVRAVHIQELRSRIDAVRAAHDLMAFPWTDGSLAGIVIRTTHLLELRAALDAAYAAASLPAPGYSELVISPQVTPIRAAHIAELRAAVVAIE